MLHKSKLHKALRPNRTISHSAQHCTIIGNTAKSAVNWCLMHRELLVALGHCCVPCTTVLVLGAFEVGLAHPGNCDRINLGGIFAIFLEINATRHCKYLPVVSNQILAVCPGVGILPGKANFQDAIPNEALDNVHNPLSLKAPPTGSSVIYILIKSISGARVHSNGRYKVHISWCKSSLVHK